MVQLYPQQAKRTMLLWRLSALSIIAWKAINISGKKTDSSGGRRGGMCSLYYHVLDNCKYGYMVT
jgi:hypothetical protein